MYISNNIGLSKSTIPRLNFPLVGVLVALMSGCGGVSNEDTEIIADDIIPPVITLVGESNVDTNVGETYIDVGASAIDDVDGEVEVFTIGFVDTSLLGDYVLTYSATDEAGNTATDVRNVSVIDLVAPEMTLLGDSDITITVGDDYSDAGATAVDNYDGAIIPLVSGAVDNMTDGVYTITYTATDSSGNSASINRVVTVFQPDVTAPAITINGEASITLDLGEIYVEEGATVVDDFDGVMAPLISSNVDDGSLGNYTVTYSATDSSGNSSSATRSVAVLDLSPPVMTMNGDEVMTHNYGDEFIDPGVTAYDTADGPVTVVVDGVVDETVFQTFYLTYTATDSSGNESTLSRTVVVSDIVAPTITITGNEYVSHRQNGIYIDQGATAYDYVNGSVSVAISGRVDVTVVGDYTITYSASDAAGNVAYAYRYVEVFDTVAPVITLNTDEDGLEDIIMYVGRDYIELGATAYDDEDGDVSVAIDDSDVDIENVGIYSVVYTASDLLNNTAISTRSVQVLSARPLITLWDATEDDLEITININDKYVHEAIYHVDWGDGDSQWSSYSSLSHTYDDAGIYSVTISGAPQSILFCYAGNADDDTNDFLGVTQWGEPTLQSFESMFYGCNHDTIVNGEDKLIVDEELPNLKGVTSLRSTFRDIPYFNHPIGDWDTSSVTDMGKTFYKASSFNQDISGWDVSNVELMDQTFYKASSFNQNIGGWDVSSVTTMAGIFSYALVFNQDIGSWPVISVVDLSGFLANAPDFAQDISDWPVNSLENLSQAFVSNGDDYSVDISAWPIESVTDMSGAFTGTSLTTDIYDQMLINWSFLDVQENVSFDAGGSVRSEGISAVDDAYIDLTDMGWTITDGTSD